MTDKWLTGVAMKNLKVMALALLLIGFIGLGFHTIVKSQQKLKLNNVELKSTTSDLLQLQVKYDILNKDLKQQLDSKDRNLKHIQDLERQKQRLEQEKSKLEKQLQARALEKAQARTIARAASIIPKAVAAGCGDNSYANYIYTHESGCSTVAMNAGGCYGIGQDCNNVVLARCGADYDCQNAYFNTYALAHCDYTYHVCYHGWPGAYAFWLAHHYW